MGQLYRKALLERMSSPEQLDKMLKVTSPMFWVALLGGGLMIAAVLVWSIFGRLPVKVEATGVFVPDQGTYSVAAEINGTVQWISAEIGDRVEKDQTVLKLDGTESASLERAAERIIALETITLESVDDEITADNVELINIKVQIQALDKEYQKKETLLAGYREELDALQPRIEEAKENADAAFARYEEADSGTAAEERLFSEYSKANAEYENLYAHGAELEQSILTLEHQLSVDEIENEVQKESLATQFEMRRAALKSSLNMQLEQQLTNFGQYLALTPVDGIVTDIKVNVGSAVMQGTEMMKIRRINEENDDVIQCYLPISQGKKVHAGMKVIVYPVTVNKQEYGHMEAEVVSVDQYVSTVSSILNSLGDESLAASFAQSGPVVGVTCRLKNDESTASGYWWSNKKGATVTLEYGTPIMADIIIEEKTPISMLLPFLNETIGLVEVSAR